MLTVPDGDHLTLLNVYNSYIQSGFPAFFNHGPYLFICFADQPNDKNWCWSNFISQRAMLQADNVRAQLQRQMEKFEIEIISKSATNPSFYTNIRMALVSGYFMQVAHKAGERGAYKTVKDNSVRRREREGEKVSF